MRRDAHGMRRVVFSNETRNEIDMKVPRREGDGPGTQSRTVAPTPRSPATAKRQVADQGTGSARHIAAADVVVHREDEAHSDLDPDTLLRVYDAVRRDLLVDGCPEFGSAAWVRLPKGDPRRDAATTRAALAWWTARVYGRGLPADVVDRIVAARVNAASKDIAGAPDWPKLIRRHLEHQRVLRRRANGYGGAA